MRKKNLQLFAYDNNAYCDFVSTAAKAIAGQNVILTVYNLDGSKLLAVSGQQGLTVNRSADSIEITSKDTEGGWKSKIAGPKEWSVDADGLYSTLDESQRVLSAAFENQEPVCLKIIDKKNKKGMFGGLAIITDFSLEAPNDDSMTYSLSFEGMGPLKDLTEDPVSPDTMPEGSAALGVLTMVSVAGETNGKTAVYINPAKSAGNEYRYKTGAAGTVDYPAYNEDCSSLTSWDGSSEITAATGNKILIVECDSQHKALKAGIAAVTSKSGS